MSDLSSSKGAVPTATVKVDSVLTHVTVYNDRALVTRSAEVTLSSAGEHTLEFTLLPESMDKQSLQVTTSNPELAMLKSVQFQKQHLEQDPNERIGALQAELDSVEEQVTAVKDQIDKNEQLVKLLKGLLTKVITPNTTGGGDSSSSQDLSDLNKWKQLMEFYDCQITATTADLRKCQKELKGLESKRQKLLADLQVVRSGGSSGRNGTGAARESVIVIVDLIAPGKLGLQLRYIVYNTRWVPLYDIRVNRNATTTTTATKAAASSSSSSSGEFELTYHAMVSQQSGEDWSSVIVELSTAQPSVGGTQPELSPWRISPFTPHNRKFAPQAADFGRENEKRASASTGGSARGHGLEWLAAVAEECDLAPQSQPLMGVTAAEVTSGTTSVTFTVAGRHSVRTDGQGVKLTILQSPFPALFQYNSVPKLAERAYLKAKIHNSQDYPLLAGEANVFVDGSYVTKIALATVPSGASCWVFLGLDEGITVKYNYIKKQESKEGMNFALLSKGRKKITYEYSIELKNNKRTPEEIVVWDQVPLAEDKQIWVELLEPCVDAGSVVPTPTTPLTRTELNYLRWYHVLGVGERIVLPLKFAVEFPASMSLTGL